MEVFRPVIFNVEVINLIGVFHFRIKKLDLNSHFFKLVKKSKTIFENGFVNN